MPAPFDGRVSIQSAFDQLIGLVESEMRGTSEFRVILGAVRSGRAYHLVETSHQGLEGLSARQQQVALLAGRGRAVKQIARELDLSVSSVDKHLQRVYRKLQVDSRALLARRTIALEVALTGCRDADAPPAE